MYKIIEEKNELLKTYRRRSAELAKWLQQSDLWYWIYSYYQIKGAPMRKRDIVDILDGKIVESVPIDAYAFIPGCAQLQKDMQSCVEMQNHPDMKLLERWASMVYGEVPALREKNPIVYEWEHIPMHFAELPQELDKLFKKAHTGRFSGTPIERAAWLHLEFLRLYPYGEDTAKMGFLLLMYSLMQAGLPLPQLNLTDREYNSLVADYLNEMKGSGLRPFCDMLERALVNRLEAALQICYQIPEEELQNV